MKTTITESRSIPESPFPKLMKCHRESGEQYIILAFADNGNGVEGTIIYKYPDDVTSYKIGSHGIFNQSFFKDFNETIQLSND